MGSASWCSSRPLIEKEETRNKVYENKLLQKISAYEFETDYDIQFTLEELIMQEFANDIGDAASPHTWAILIAEFRKFIFLNKMNISLIGKEKGMTYLMYDDDSKSTVYLSLVASP